MNLSKIIAELQSERNRLDQAIVALERLSGKNNPRRGRPSAWPKRELERDEEQSTDNPARSIRQRGATVG